MKNRIGPCRAAGLHVMNFRRSCQVAGCLLLVLVAASLSWAATTGSISGTLKDPSGAVIPGATVTALNIAQGIQSKTTTDDKGFYIFPSLPVGRYNVQAEASGFKTAKRNDLVVDLDSALQIDLAMEMIER